MSVTARDGVSAETIASISTPDTIESRLGTLQFNDGAPTDATAALLYDNLDFQHGVQAFLGAFPGVSVAAIHRGLRSIGVKDNEVLLFSELMDSASLFLTANCDTIYAITMLDLSNGPVVIDVPALGPPSGFLGTVDDMWFRWVTDLGLPGPDRAQGGRYLIVGPYYHGPLPDSGFHVSHCRTAHALAFLRGFMVENDPRIPSDAVRDRLRIYPYRPGALGTAIGTFLRGGVQLGAVQPIPETRIVEGSGVAFNTIPPNDFSFWESVHELLQQEPADAGEPELLGQLAAVGIVKGKPFAPDARMRAILEEAVQVGNAMARTVSVAPRPEEGFYYYPDSQWFNMLWVGGTEFMDPPAQITPHGAVPAGPSDGARKINSRTAWFYPYTGVTPAMCMRLTGIGSQYIMAMRDGAGEFLDGDRNYKITLPPDIPESRFWSVMLYDRQTRSMLQTGQPKPDVSSQSGTVVTNDDGTTDVYIGPAAPDGHEANWLETAPGKGFFVILRLYNPLQPFFDKSWRAGEIEPVN